MCIGQNNFIAVPILHNTANNSGLNKGDIPFNISLKFDVLKLFFA